MLYTVLGLRAMLKLATFVLNDVHHVWMSLNDTVTLKRTERSQGRSAALNVTANDETSAVTVSELMLNIGQDGTPVCGGIQQSICEYLEEPSLLYTNKYNTHHEKDDYVLNIYIPITVGRSGLITLQVLVVCK